MKSNVIPVILDIGKIWNLDGTFNKWKQQTILYEALPKSLFCGKIGTIQMKGNKAYLGMYPVSKRARIGKSNNKLLFKANELYREEKYFSYSVICLYKGYK